MSNLNNICQQFQSDNKPERFSWQEFWRIYFTSWGTFIGRKKGKKLSDNIALSLTIYKPDLLLQQENFFFYVCENFYFMQYGKSIKEMEIGGKIYIMND